MTPRPEGRSGVGAALGVVLVAGLASRRIDALPDLIEDHAGDALWCTAAVLALAVLWPRWSPGVHALLGFAVALLVELSQLWKSEWLEDLRDNDLAALVLGRGFLWGDLVRYAVGAVLGWLVLRGFGPGDSDQPADTPSQP